VMAGSGWLGRSRTVSVADDGTVWGVNSEDEIYRWEGARWQQATGSLKQICAGSATRLGVNGNDNVFRLT
jgi:hypothetical protein